MVFSSLQGCCAISKESRGDELMLFTDSNWGPQDASKLVPNETQTVSTEELGISLVQLSLLE